MSCLSRSLQLKRWGFPYKRWSPAEMAWKAFPQKRVCGSAWLRVVSAVASGQVSPALSPPGCGPSIHPSLLYCSVSFSFVWNCFLLGPESNASDFCSWWCQLEWHSWLFSAHLSSSVSHVYYYLPLRVVVGPELQTHVQLVFVSRRLQNRLLQTWLWTTNISSVTIPEARSLKSRCR